MTTRAAFFDVDGTLLKSNVVDYYLYLIQELPRIRRWWLFSSLFLKAPYYWVVDRFSRHQFNQIFYRNYRNLPVTESQQWSQKQVHERLLLKLFPDAMDCLIQHQSHGDKIVLVTGSLDFIVAPLARLLGVDVIFTASLEVKDGKFTGKLAKMPVAGQEKARLVQHFATQFQIDLKESYAYGDSIADLPMLQAVGYPVAVNPDSRLRQIAQQKGWTVKQWQLATFAG